MMPLKYPNLDQDLVKKHRGVYYQMRVRCYNENHKQYKDYGGRGIKVCDRWLESFDNWFTDMGIRPDGYQLDRKDNDGDYEPSNCKWSSPKENANNRRPGLTSNKGWHLLLSEEQQLRRKEGYARRSADPEYRKKLSKPRKKL